MRVLSLLAALSVGFAGSLAAQDESWKGKAIILKGGKTPLIQEEGGVQVLLGELRHMTYRVKDEKNERLLVRQGGVDGWIDKTHALPIDQALEYFNERLAQAPDSPSFLSRRAEIFRFKGEHDKAIADLDEAVRVAPQEPAFYNNRALSHSAKKNYDEALRDYHEALRLKPNHPLYLRNRGSAYVNKKDYDKALADFHEAMQLDPRDPAAHHGRGRALAGKKEYPAAIQAWERSLAIDPDMNAALNSWAWLLATCPDASVRDGAKAVTLAKKACEASDWKEAGVIDTLAAAHAEAGQFADAIRFQEMALKDARFSKSEAAQQRLKLYMEKKAYRED